MKIISIVLLILGLIIGAIIGFSLSEKDCPTCETAPEQNQTNNPPITNILPTTAQLAADCANSPTFYYPGAGALAKDAGIECYEFMKRIVHGGSAQDCEPFAEKIKAICVGSSLNQLHYDNYCESLGEYKNTCLLNLANHVVFRTNTPLSEVEEFCSEFEDETYTGECLYLIEFKQNGTYRETNVSRFGPEGWGYYGNSPGYPF
jgi:hypothetical protein